MAPTDEPLCRCTGATQAIHNGDVVEVDPVRGVVCLVR